ncbi:MAG: hypothetical protein ABEI86_09265, partial [Halobacteriaceae archaeon]
MNFPAITTSRQKLVWSVLFGSLILYLPINLLLMYLGFVDAPRVQDFGAYYNAAVRFLNSE